MLSFIQVSKHYGTQDVLREVSLEILPGRKIGLIGPNGGGKTTLVRLLVGLEEPSEGKVARAADLRLGYVPQQVEFEDGLTVEGYLLEEHRTAAAELRAQEAALGEAPPQAAEKALAAYQRARDGYDALGGDDLPRRMEGLISSMGLAGTWGRKVDTLSGGERNVLSLARALTRRPNLLVLDEPGNHLDFAGLAWLERFLAEFDGAVLVVSHNRYLLDRVVGRIWELENRRLKEYDGNYSKYRLTRLREAVAQQADYVANQKKLAQLEALVARFAEIARAHPDPAWGRRLHSRRTQLAKAQEQAVEKPVMDTARIRLVSQAERTRADIALQVNGYSKAFGEKALFRGADLQIGCGERVALVGPNGCGKTTFLRDVVEKSRWDDTTLRVGPSLKVGYCAQHQEVFRPERTVLEEFQELGLFTRKEVFTALARFLFRWEDLDKRIGDLSGGERNRLQLARVMMLKANFLILDEPTNHMDIGSQEAIEESLSAFEGTILVVSHDRYLLDRIATSIVEVEGGRFETFQGSFSEFWAGREPYLARGAGRVLTRGKQQEAARREERRRLGKAGKETAAGRERAADLERRIGELEDEKRAVEAKITEAFAAGDHQGGRRLAMRLDRVSRMLEELYGEWERTAG